jgi:hypothetical protein
MDPRSAMFFCGLAFLAGGVLAIGGAALNLDAFMNSPKAQPFVQAMSRGGARIFYIVLGLVFAAIGGFLLLNLK